jgi:hypothetical protein
MTKKTWWEAPIGGSVLSFLKAEWKVSDTGSAHWASSYATFAKYFLNNECHVQLQNKAILSKTAL